MTLLRNSLLAALMIVLIALMGCSSGPLSQGSGDDTLDDFAKCLSDEGVKMFGAYWCPHCDAQKEMFGASFKNIKYIECSLPERAGQTQYCKDKKIKGYPTWEFADGTRIEEEATFEQLANKTGCVLAEGEQNG